MSTLADNVKRAVQLLPTGTYTLYSYIASIISPKGTCGQSDQALMWAAYAVVGIMTVVLAICSRKETGVTLVVGYPPLERSVWMHCKQYIRVKLKSVKSVLRTCVQEHSCCIAGHFEGSSYHGKGLSGGHCFQCPGTADPTRLKLPVP